MNESSNARTGNAQGLRTEISAAISGMIYISESEAPLELLDWPGIHDIKALQEKIDLVYGLAPDAQSILLWNDFLDSIRRTADPADPAMLEYVQQYESLSRLLQSSSEAVTVIRAGETEVHVFIAAFAGEHTLVIHTTSIET